ncbi:amino acid ABC transporter ATP-binding protein [Candidatus Bipolaricaulota bacterium]|nr:amino acid ABC transporter ATP-binding protein [Candidatus Bipolaricaulota bacterium]
MGNILVEIKDLHKSFGEEEVLKGVDLDVERGEVVCIMGPSGAGKSTFLRCINRLEEPDSGTIKIDGEPITGDNVDLNKMRTEIGMVFQQFNLFPHMNALSNITLALKKVKNMSKAEADKKGLENLEKVGLKYKAESKPDQLSGGQKQRVAMARALAMDPKLMLFDEPTSALDPELIEEVVKVMLDLAEMGMTMIAVTHEISFAKGGSDRVCLLDQGNMLEQAPTEKFFNDPEHDRTREFLSMVLD